jgi:hypothetical protein
VLMYTSQLFEILMDMHVPLQHDPCMCNASEQVGIACNEDVAGGCFGFVWRGGCCHHSYWNLHMGLEVPMGQTFA